MYSQPSLLQKILGHRRLLLIGSAALVLLMILIAVIMANSHDPVQEGLERLTVRYDNLVKLTSDARSHIRSDKLTKLNSEANILLTSTDNSLSTLVKTRYGGVPSEIKDAEADTSSAATLKNAGLLNTYDSVYAGVLRDKLSAILALTDEVRAGSNNSETLTLLKNARTSIIALQERLSALNL